MARNPPQTLGSWRGVTFAVAQIDVVAATDALLVVGMLEKDVAADGGGGAIALDAALHGTLSRLRAGGIFQGRFGETLMLTRPPEPIQAGTLMLVGMGGSLAANPVSVRDLTAVAMRAALRIGAGSVACLLGWSELDIPTALVEESARAMMHGALAAIDAQDAPVAAMRWTFDIRNGEAARTAAALAAALAAWR